MPWFFFCPSSCLSRALRPVRNASLATTPLVLLPPTSVFAAVNHRPQRCRALPCSSTDADALSLLKAKVLGQVDREAFAAICSSTQRFRAAIKLPIRYGELSERSVPRSKQRGDNTTQRRQARTLIACRIFIVQTISSCLLYAK